MSHLQELIDQLCPDGVEYKKLGEVAHYAKERIPASSVDENTYVGVENLLQNKMGKEKATSVPSSGMVIAFQTGDVLIGNIRPYLKKIWLADCDGGTNGDVLAVQLDDRQKLMPEFLYYVLSSEQFFFYDVKNSKGAKMPRGNKTAMMNYPIPVPPMEVQREIVRILDDYSARTAELIKELEAELEARKKQYEFYRDQLLSFDDVRVERTADLIRKTPENTSVFYISLRNVVKHSCSGATPAKGNPDYYKNGTIPWIRTQDVTFNEIYKVDSFITDLAVEKTGAKWIPEDCVIVAISGASAGRCAINKIKATTNQHCLNMEIDPEKALYKYVYYCVSSKYTELLSKKQGARGDLNSKLILDTKIPVPPLAEQERIVAILDRFDVLCNDLTSGLPAEIAARQKQYEYYRDKLLSFPQAQ